jgi:hypothetical protein
MNLQKPFSKNELLEISSYLDEPETWGSLVINKRKPYTQRLFRLDGAIRTCLHMFEPCKEEESFGHTHSWPARFMCLQGSYFMRSAFYYYHSSDVLIKTNSSLLTAGSWYEMSDPALYHKIVPLEPSFTIMQNGMPYRNPHESCVTTRGKELLQLDEASTHALLESFQSLIDNYLYASE